MIACSRYPCGGHSGGCSFVDCVNNPLRQLYSPQTPGPYIPPAPMGCICPPTSEKTCENPMCPRKGITIGAGTTQLSNGDRDVV
jgi:hypothetical protein